MRRLATSATLLKGTKARELRQHRTYLPNQQESDDGKKAPNHKARNGRTPKRRAKEKSDLILSEAKGMETSIITEGWDDATPEPEKGRNRRGHVKNCVTTSCC